MTTNTEARFFGQQAPKAGTIRVIWHPYSTDDPKIDVTGDSASDIVGALWRLSLIKQNQGLSPTLERELDRAIERGREINWPHFGCIRYERHRGDSYLSVHPETRGGTTERADDPNWHTSRSDAFGDPACRLPRCEECKRHIAFEIDCGLSGCPFAFLPVPK